MKKLVILNVLLFLFASISAYTGTTESEIPKPITESLHKILPDSKDKTIKWYYSSKEKEYKATFYRGVLSVNVYISSDAHFLRYSETMLLKDVPANIASYIKKNYADATITSAYRWTRDSGSSFLIKIKDKDRRTSSLGFDEEGNMITIF